MLVDVVPVQNACAREGVCWQVALAHHEAIVAIPQHDAVAADGDIRMRRCPPTALWAGTA